MKKLLFLLLVFISQLCFAQNENLKNNTELSIGLSDFGKFLNYKSTNGVVNLNINHWLSKYLDLGIQAGVGRQFDQYGPGIDKSISMYLYKYSATSRFHLSPFIRNPKDLKTDIYLKGIFGGQTVEMVESITSPASSTEIDYGLYLGLSYNPIWKINIYGEVGIGKNSYSQIGLSMKL